MSAYQQLIREHAAALGHLGANPRHIEAWMRLEKGTLDALTPEQFRHEVKAAIACIAEAGDHNSEVLAESYGLGADRKDDGTPVMADETLAAYLVGEGREQVKARAAHALTWTPFIAKCTNCGRRFRVSQQAIDENRESMDTEGQTDQQIAESFDFCIGCIIGASPEGEYDVPIEVALTPVHEHDGHFQITGLTVADIVAIRAALDVANDDEDEPFPGIRDVHAKVEKVYRDLRALGVLGEPKEVTTTPLYAESPESKPENFECTVCGNTREFVGIDDHGYGGPDECECERPHSDACICETVLTQPFNITGVDTDGSPLIDYHAFTGGGNNAEIGSYTRIDCGKCGQRLWQED